MAGSIIAREYGDEYQQLVFLKYALKMLNDDAEISSIDYEDDKVKSFDDVVITHSIPQTFRDSKIKKEFYQIKFHMCDDKLITLDGLLDPAFVSASKYAFLDKAVMAYRKLGDSYSQGVFILYTPYDIKQDDVLYSLISNTDSTFRIETIFDGTTDNSKMGRVRKKLRERLGVDQNELRLILQQIRICSRRERIDELIEDINIQLEHNGLQRISGGSYLNPYTQLIGKLFRAGVTHFDKLTIIQHLKNEGLYTKKRKVVDVAIRSYLHHAEDLDEEVESVLKLENYFEGRVLKNGYKWKANIYTELKNFFDKEVNDSDKDYHIRFEANPTIAFMAGRILDIKSGISIIPCQRTEKGIVPWNNLKTDSTYTEAQIENLEIDNSNDDVAVVIEFSREILNDVKEYIYEEELKIRRIIDVKLFTADSSSVLDGRHAWCLANQIKNVIDGRKLKEKRGVLHLFLACPISVVFVLSRYSLSFGKVQMYEYDFMKTNTCTYFPTLLFSAEEEL